MLIEAMQQEPAWPFTAFTASPRARGKLSPLTWQGHRGTQITQEVSLSVLWWREGPGGGGAEPLQLVSLSPAKQKHLLSVCQAPESPFCWDSPGDPKQSPCTKVKRVASGSPCCWNNSPHSARMGAAGCKPQELALLRLQSVSESW